MGATFSASPSASAGMLDEKWSSRDTNQSLPRCQCHRWWLYGLCHNALAPLWGGGTLSKNPISWVGGTLS